MKKIVCIHLLNDYSGSPLVLSQSIKGLIDNGHDVDVYTNKNSEGFLTHIAGVNYFYFNYSWGKSKALTLLYFVCSQLFLFLRLLKYRKQDVVIYVNTILPFGAAVAGKVMNKKVVYHIHETSIKPALFKSFLLKIAQFTASTLIYVSTYLRTNEFIEGVKSHTVYNALSEDFVSRATLAINQKAVTKNILMLCSLKKYKGIDVYIQLARLHPSYSFTLVLNCKRAEITEYFKGRVLSPNLIIHSAQKNVHSFFKEADLVLNLSLIDEWIETFGMTVLEAMSYGIPVIVPPVGGIAELVIDEFNGFKIDSKNVGLISTQMDRILTNKSFYNYLSFNARKKASDFSNKNFINGIIEVVQSS